MYMVNEQQIECFFNFWFMQIIYGLVDRVMEKVGFFFVFVEDNIGYYIECLDVSIL